MRKKVKQSKFSILYNRLSKNKTFKYLVYFILFIILWIFTKKMFIYCLFVVFTGVIIYYSKFYHFPIDISPLFFLEIVITRYYGFGYTLLFVVVAYIIPKTIAGTSAQWMSYVFISFGLLANMFVFIFPNMSLQMIGYLSSVVQYILGVMFQSTVKPMFLAIGDGFANVLNNLVWFLIFSDLIILIL